MSDTPRTDLYVTHSDYIKPGMDSYVLIVPADVCRQIERELVSAKEALSATESELRVLKQQIADSSCTTGLAQCESPPEVE